MKYIDADRLRAEIERRLKYTHDWLRGDEKRHPKQTPVSKNYYKMKGDERTLDALLNFIDSLRREQPSLNDEIKKFIEEYGFERGEDKLLIAIVARHFAEWGAKHTETDEEETK